MFKLCSLLAIFHAGVTFGLPVRDLRREPEKHIARALPASSSLQITTSYSTAFSSLQSASATIAPSVTGSVNTALPSGHDTGAPFDSTLPLPEGSLAPATTTLDPHQLSTTAPTSANIFVAIATDAPPVQIEQRSDHPVKQLGIKPQELPYETNKFYANFFLGGQSNPTWTQPYSLSWSKGGGNAESWGLAVSHIERSDFAWQESGDPPEYFIGPIGLQSIILSAVELGSSTCLSTDDLQGFSANVNLAPSSDDYTVVTFPLVQGMGLVTAVYTGGSPLLQSGIFFKTLQYVGPLNGVTFKYQIVLDDETEWLLYATPAGSLGAPPFTLINSTTIEGPRKFNGTVQVAKNPSGQSGEDSYDKGAGAYALSASISASVDGSSGTYTLSWRKGGVQNQTLIMFALPHLVDSFDDTTLNALTDIHMTTITKGMARAVVSDGITMIEESLPTEIGFAPWQSTGSGGQGTNGDQLSNSAITAINIAAKTELNEDFTTQSVLDSMYYSGKGLAKFAGIIYTMQDLAGNSALAAAGLDKLKDVFNVFVNNTQPYPLAYDTVWKGAVSIATYTTGDTGADFGNSLYNDHHFHYGYFVYTAAVIGYLDSEWLTEGDNKAWVNMLVRDYANPSAEDPYFPFQRSFDWFHGHSWAKGLFDSGDGKDEESSSEDAFSSYAIKMWGMVIGDANMEARGNLQLAVAARSLQHYFLLESTNTVQPARFIPNKVTGILFENKIDHTTYFGTNTEYIEGIHMIPLNPSSSYTRTKNFVQEEWDTYFANGYADTVEGGWKGILYANLALIDPITSYNFFAAEDFNYTYLDGGASRTWYLAYAAGLGGTT